MRSNNISLIKQGPYCNYSSWGIMIRVIKFKNNVSYVKYIKTPTYKGDNEYIFSFENGH